MAWNVTDVNDILIQLFENISTSNNINGIAFNTTVKKVGRRFVTLSEQKNFPSLVLVLYDVSMKFEATKRDVVRVFADGDLYGYIQGSTGVDADTKLSFLKKEINKLVQDCMRVFAFIGVNFVNGTPPNPLLPANFTTNVAVAGTPRWLLDSSLQVKFTDGYDVDNNKGDFVAPFRIEIMFSDINLGAT